MESNLDESVHVDRISRRQWLGTLPVAAIAGVGVATGSLALAEGLEADGIADEYPAQSPEKVRAVVGASHANIDAVRELVEANPSLSRASWDWGFGDWETALGAASHIGRRDIAELLISHGARPNLFTLAMLGKLAAVKATIEAMPGIQRIPGPHGISLLNHARHGGEESADVVKYLESLGDADPRAESQSVSDELKQQLLGKYSFAAKFEGFFEVMLTRRGDLALRRGERVSRTLHRVEEFGFSAAGVPSVRIRFDVVDGAARALTIHDPSPVVKAIRQ